MTALPEPIAPQGPSFSDSPMAVRFDRLRRMKCFASVEEMLTEGQPLKAVLYVIRSSKEREVADLSDNQLMARLSQYRRLVAPIAALRKTDPKLIDRAREKLREGINVSAEFEELYRIQKKRIKAMVASEEDTGVPSKQTSDSIRVAAELLRAIQSVREGSGMSQVDEDRARTVPVVRRYGPEIGKVVDDPASRQRILDFVRSSLVLGQRRRELSLSDDGGASPGSDAAREPETVKAGS